MLDRCLRCQNVGTQNRDAYCRADRKALLAHPRKVSDMRRCRQLASKNGRAVARILTLPKNAVVELKVFHSQDSGDGLWDWPVIER